MKKYLLQLLPALFIFTAAETRAQEWHGQDACCYEDACCMDGTSFYAKVFSGVNFLQNTKIDRNRATYDAGYLFAASFGYSWCYGLSLEGEYAYRRNGINRIHLFGQDSARHGHLQTSSWMANLFWEMPLSSLGCSFCPIQPFIGAGIGYDFQQMHASNSRVDFHQKWNHFAWQLMAGLAYEVYCDAEFTLEYRFHQGGSHFNNQSLGVGLLYKFDLSKF